MLLKFFLKLLNDRIHLQNENLLSHIGLVNQRSQIYHFHLKSPYKTYHLKYRL